MPGDNSDVWPATTVQSDADSPQFDSPYNSQSESATEPAAQDQDITDVGTDVSDESTESPRYPMRQRRPPTHFKNFVDSQGRH